jgi:glycerol kinase
LGSDRYVLAIDQGTTGTRAIIFNEDGLPVANGISYREHRQIYPRPGWVEHDPLEIWNNTKKVVHEAIKNSGINPKKIVSIGITNQRETVVVWDTRTGQPLYNAIVWQDRRTADISEKLKRNYGELIHRKTGLIPDPYFSATKIMWLMNNIEGLRTRLERGEAVVGTIDSWLVWQLTHGVRDVPTLEKGGAHVTDYSNASRTMLFNIEKLEWDNELLEIMGKIPEAALPLLMPSSHKECYGHTGPEASKLIGAEIPVCSIIGDQQAALIGQAGFNKSDMKATYGTGTFILVNTGKDIVYSRRGLLTTVYYSIRPRDAYYAIEGSIFATGAAIQWLRDGLKIIEVPGEVDALAEAAKDTGGVYFVPAFTGLGAPYWDPYARGLIIGLTRATERRHIVRAVMESIAYMTRDVVEVIREESGLEITALKTDGGVSKSDFLMQFLADILGIEVLRPLVKETTSLGAAFLAGIAGGLWKNVEDVKRLWRPEKVFKPSMEPEKRDKLYSGWRAALRRALGWAREVPWAYS